MTPTPISPPALHPPLEVRWSATIEAEHIRHRPVTDGAGTLVVAAHDHLLCLDLGSGKQLWDRPQPHPITEIQACDDGPVIALGGSDDVELVAFRWTGEPVWRTRSGIGTGGDRLRGCGASLIAIGVPTGKSTTKVCQVRDAHTGAITLTFPCDGDLPDMVDGRFVYSARSDDKGGGGLFLYDPQAKKSRRLIDVGHWIRVVAEGIAVVDTFDDDNRSSRLIAVDLATGKTLWKDTGGPNLSLAASGGQLACAVGVDESHVAMTLRDIRTGKLAWTAKAVEAKFIAPLLAADCVVGSIALDRIDIYDRASGERVQSLAQKSSLVQGGCISKVGLIDVASRTAVCFTATNA